MKRVSSYLKMRVLGAIEGAPGETIIARIHHVSEQVFLDEDGQRFRFTWRTIQTWYSRYKKDGTTTVLPKPRSDKGKTRKMAPEDVLEAIEQVRGRFHGPYNITAFYRACIEHGLLQRERIAPNTFRRVVKAHELLKPDAEVSLLTRAEGKAFQIDPEGHDVRCERRLIAEARRLNAAGKMLAPIIDDAHLMDVTALRKIRLLFEDFPKNHCLVLVAQPELLQNLTLTVNEDLKNRVTYSVLLKKLAPDSIADFIRAELDKSALAHSTFSDDALSLIVRSSEGGLRKARNLCLGALLEAVRDRTRTVELKQVNRVLLQPHWRKEVDLPH
ncbi:MAG TPA: hypothetical protein VJN18_13180 [Polyangiaceae bacterium]|nr:hypothetical protein [Polyangiaceae bacterium]